MADIQITCPVCEKNVTVSEYANPEAMICPVCGEKLTMPAKAAGKEKSSRRLGLACQVETPPEPAPPVPSEEDASLEWRFTAQTRNRIRPEKKIWVGPAVMSWLIFSVLAFIMFFVRYHGVIPFLTEAHIKTTAPFVYLAFHIIITLKAFKDSVFNGILCFLLPPYALYYLFFVCDDFYLRAVFGGVLVGIGSEAFIFFQAIVRTFFAAAHRFIQGGALR